MRNLCVVALTLVTLGACSGTDNGSPRSAGTGGGSSVGGATSGVTGGGPAFGKVGGATAAGAAAAIGGASTASGGRGVAVGGTNSSGGSSALGGGVSQAGGSNFAAGSASGGASDLGIASALNTRVEVPCIGAHDGELCSAVMTLPAKTLALGGDVQHTYKVTLHIRGVTEGHTFMDLNNQPVGTVTPAPYFLDSTQGTPNEDAHAVFWLDVPQPAKKYYFNAFYSLEGAFDHQIFALDYLADITVKGGASVTFNYKDDNTEQAANVNVVAPGVPPAPQVFDGQFVQIDVVSVMQLN